MSQTADDRVRALEEQLGFLEADVQRLHREAAERDRILHRQGEQLDALSRQLKTLRERVGDDGAAGEASTADGRSPNGDPDGEAGGLVWPREG